MTSVPEAADAATVSTTVKVAEEPAPRSPTVHVGSLKLPALGVIESTVTPAGRVSVSVSATPDAPAGPLLVTVTTYVRLPAPEPAITGSNDSVLVTARST